jgi:hypothetical protein
VFDQESREFELRATYGMSEQLIASLKLHHTGLSEGLGQATEQRAPVQVADLRNEPSTPAQQRVQNIVLEAGYRARMIVPCDRRRVTAARASSNRGPERIRPGLSAAFTVVR